jgi:hypothetical protein
MNTLTYKKPLSEIVASWQSMVESTNAATLILSKLGEGILKNQSETSAAWITEASQSSATLLHPQDAAQALWQVPGLYQTQSRRMVDSMLATASLLSGGQQELMEWAGQVYAENIRQTTQSMSGVFGTLASRRLSADVIDFSNRRSQPSAESTAESSASANDKTNHRANREAAG